MIEASNIKLFWNRAVHLLRYKVKIGNRKESVIIYVLLTSSLSPSK